MVLACSLYSNKKYHYAVMDACQFFVRVTVPELTAVFDINFDRESSLEMENVDGSRELFRNRQLGAYRGMLLQTHCKGKRTHTHTIYGPKYMKISSAE